MAFTPVLISSISIRLADTNLQNSVDRKSTYIKRQANVQHLHTYRFSYFFSPPTLKQNPTSITTLSFRACNLLHQLKILQLSLHNHLRNTLSAKRLTRSKFLLLQPSQRVERRSDQQHDCRSNQARRVANQGQPLDHAHDSIDAGAHVVCFEAADKAVEDFGGRTDAQEEGDFNEDEDEAGNAVVRMGS